MLALLEAKSVFIYSAPKSMEKVDLRRKFGIGKQQKVLVATMSSHDERFAAVTIGVMPESRDLVFPTQVDWIGALIEFVAKRPELFLIIRVHPREFPNKRETVVSEYASELKSLFVDLPVNAKVNWPADEVSLYDIANMANVFLNSRSTTGFEMSLLGLPVVVYSPDQLYSYPSDLNYMAISREKYFQEIDRAISDGWNIERSRMAYRWGVFQHYHSTINISESFHDDTGERRSIAQRGVSKICRILSPLYQQKRDCKNRASKLNSAILLNSFLISGKADIVELRPEPSDVVSLEQETEGLKREFRRIYAEMYRNEINVESSSMQEQIKNFIDS
jgi:hypothetical protein